MENYLRNADAGVWTPKQRPSSYGITELMSLTELLEVGGEKNLDEFIKRVDEDYFVLFVKNDKGNTPLHTAVLKQNDVIIDQICNIPVNGIAYALLQSRNDQGARPLNLSVECGDAHIVQLIAERCAGIVDCLEDSISPLQMAARDGTCDILKILLECGADPNFLTHHTLRSPVQLAVGARSLERVKILFEHGALTNKGLYYTPLEMAKNNNDSAIIEFLTENERSDCNWSVPVTKSGCFDKAQEAFREEQYFMALYWYTQAMCKDLVDKNPCYGRSKCYFYLGMLDHAWKEVDVYLQFNQKDADAHLHKSLILDSRGDLDGAQLSISIAEYLRTHYLITNDESLNLRIQEFRRRINRRVSSIRTIGQEEVEGKLDELRDVDAFLLFNRKDAGAHFRKSLILESRGDLNGAAKSISTALHLTTEDKSLERSIRELYGKIERKGRSIGIEYIKEQRPLLSFTDLLEAGGEKNLYYCKRIIKEDHFALFVKDKNGNTPLHIAVIEHNDDIVNRICGITVGDIPCALLLCRDAQGDRPLTLSVRCGVSSIVKLIANGCTKIVDHFEDKISPLQMAARDGYCDILKILLTCGANPNFTTHYELQRPLQLAASAKSDECVKTLLEHGASELSD